MRNGGMSRADATYHRKRAEECREAAAKANELAAKMHWQEAQACWLYLAQLAETVTETAERSKANQRKETAPGGSS
jgi:hypothetical protein